MIIQGARRVTETLVERGIDDWGDGAWGSSRGSRPHRGVDLLVAPGTQIFSPVEGVVSRHGTCYEDDPEYVYIQVQIKGGYQVRFMYCNNHNTLPIGSKVRPMLSLGEAQNISARYSDPNKSPMGNHIHVEVRRKVGDTDRVTDVNNVYGQWEYFNPNAILV